MKVSLSWLNEYIPVTLPVADLADALTMAGLEVGAVEDRYDYLETVVVGRVAAVTDHPNSDHLKLCRVEAGDRAVSVVCGAPNVAEGMLSPLARPGTVLPDGTVIQASVIRGETSEGMLCSEIELGLGEDASGIMALDPGLTPGENLKQALGLSDPVLDLELTPNRPDCLSIIGIAREVRAIQNGELKPPPAEISDRGRDIDGLTSVTIEAPDLCPRYTARVCVDVAVGPSPFWLQDRLMSVGLKPINNIVDITNFVMMETGQPLHAFDLDRLAENRIVVRTAGEEKKFTTLDGKTRELKPEMLMICDGRRPVAVAGVMGGLDSEIENDTRRVLLESACFNPASIRRTAKALGLSTDAAYRFERGVDPLGTVAAVNRAALLIAETGAGRLVDGLIDAHPRPVEAACITLDPVRTNQLLGTDLSADRMTDLLASVGFAVQPGRDGSEVLSVTVPTFRVDVTRDIDLVEEIARLEGYNNIPTTFPRIDTAGHRPNPALDLRDGVRRLMTGFGFTEAINYSFHSLQSPDQLKIPPDDDRRRMVRVLNPLTEDQAAMRTSLVPGLLESVRRNLSWGTRDLKLFEIGKVFFAADTPAQLPEEIEMLGALWTGVRRPAAWLSKPEPCDFYDLKGAAEGLLQALGIGNPVFTRQPPEACAYMRIGHSARILVDGQAVGTVAEVAAEVLAGFDIGQPVFLLEIDLNRLLPLVPASRTLKPIPRFPAVTRDVTFIIDRDIETMSILESLRQMKEELVEDVYLFDVFEGDPIAAGKKSISFRIVYRSASRTLEDDVVNRKHKALTDRLIEKFNASLPG